MFGQSKSKSPANKGDQVVQFRMRDAERIAGVVQAYETAVRESKESKLPRAFIGGCRPRIGKTSEEWKKGTMATITLWESGEAPNFEPSGETLEAFNPFADVPAGRWVSLQCGPGVHVLNAAEC